MIGDGQTPTDQERLDRIEFLLEYLCSREVGRQVEEPQVAMPLDYAGFVDRRRQILYATLGLTHV